MRTRHTHLSLCISAMLGLGACSDHAPGNKVPFKYEGSAHDEARASTKRNTHIAARAQHTARATSPGKSATVRDSATATPQAARTTGVPGLSIKRLVFAKDVVDREPVGPGRTFSHADTDKVWLFLELENATASALTLNVSFRPENDAAPASRGVELSVPPAKRHRTRAFTSTDKAPGRYRCIVRTREGVIIANEWVEIRA